MVAYLATDGSSVPDKETIIDNNYISASGYIISVYECNRHLYDLEDVKYIGRTTNQIAELYGLIAGLESIIKNKLDEMCQIIIIVDSDFIRKSLLKRKLDIKRKKTKYDNLLNKAFVLFDSLKNGALIFKIKSHITDSNMYIAFENFKSDNRVTCSFNSFKLVKNLNERADENVGIVTRYIKERLLKNGY
jgi:ribonuclease HI